METWRGFDVEVDVAISMGILRVELLLSPEDRSRSVQSLIFLRLDDRFDPSVSLTMTS